MKLASFNNQKPDKPDKPTGEKNIEVGTEYHYTSNTTDSDGDQVYYLWDWGDGNYSEWLGPIDSGDTCYVSYIWADNGTYDIRVMSKDEFDAEGDWSDPLTVSTPRSRTVYNSLFQWLFEQFPNLIPILKHILKV